MRALLLAVVALSSLLGGVAAAADLPIAQLVPVYRKPIYFTGCYLGANVGTGWSWASVDDPNLFLVPPGLGGTDLGTQQTAGLIGGVQGGCDYQVGSFVFGAQGMFDGGRMTGHTIWQAAPKFANNGKIPGFGTLTGRAGVTFVPAAMFYAKVGLAFLHHDYSRDQFGVALATGSAGGIGWTAGLGVEWIIFGNWSLWAEYNYIGIGRRDVTFTLTGPGAIAFPAAAAAASFPLRIQENINAFQVGFNYRFMAAPYY